jgi:hypothetical protein
MAKKTRPSLNLVISTGAQRSGEICVVFSPFIAQIGPGRIRLLDKPNLLRTSPMLDLLLPTNRIPDIPVVFKPNQPIASVITRKTRTFRLAMFFRPSLNAIRDSHIENVRTARHNINVVVMFFSHLHTHFSGLRPKWYSEPASNTNISTETQSWCRKLVGGNNNTSCLPVAVS